MLLSLSVRDRSTNAGNRRPEQGPHSVDTAIAHMTEGILP